MSSINQQTITSEQKRKRRTRWKMLGQKKHPRLSVFRSNQYLYAQIIDDQKRQTLVSASSQSLKKGSKEEALKKNEAAKEVGKQLAKEALKKGITQVVFDRGAYKFHGLVKSLADGAREGGLKF
ncbi:MAG: 50S ribosomal protein L18 [bacterium]|nr:50S ribosomal protein L18 [bacterium]